MGDESSIIELQRYIVDLEQFVKDLNSVVVEQGQRIQKIEKEMVDLRSSMDSAQEEIRGPEKPPHY